MTHACEAYKAFKSYNVYDACGAYKTCDAYATYEECDTKEALFPCVEFEA